MAAIEEKVSITNKRQTFSVRGTPISLYIDSSIFCLSKMLSAMLERWSGEDMPYLDIDPQSFHFLVSFSTHTFESQDNPSRINDLLTKRLTEEFLKNPQYILGARYLEMNIESVEYLLKEDWDCQDSEVESLNACVKEKKKMHYVDCFVYIAFMLKEKNEKFNDVHLLQKRGVDDSYPQKTLLCCLSLTIRWPHDDALIEASGGSMCEEEQLIFGTNYHGSYSCQHSFISYKPLKEILTSIYKLKHPRTKEFCQVILTYMRGQENTHLRKI